jgi:hypothetical protein
MQTSARILLAVSMALLAAPTASAQETRFSIAVKGGASVEDSEDGLTGTAAAFGAAGLFRLNRRWRGEVEFWLPGYLEDDRGRPRHRDILLGFSAVRSFGDRAARPFLLAGLSISRTQDWFRFCAADRVLDPGGQPRRVIVSCDETDVIDRREERNEGTDGFAQVGGGVEFSITPRLNLVADLRVSLAPAAMLLRPAVGVVFDF